MIEQTKDSRSANTKNKNKKQRQIKTKEGWYFDRQKMTSDQYFVEMLVELLGCKSRSPGLVPGFIYKYQVLLCIWK